MVHRHQRKLLKLFQHAMHRCFGDTPARRQRGAADQRQVVFLAEIDHRANCRAGHACILEYGMQPEIQQHIRFGAATGADEIRDLGNRKEKEPRVLGARGGIGKRGVGLMPTTDFETDEFAVGNLLHFDKVHGFQLVKKCAGLFVGVQVEPFAQLAVCCHPFASLHRITAAIHRAQRRPKVGQRKKSCIAEQQGLPLLADGRIFNNAVEKTAVDAAVGETDKLFGGKLVRHGVASSMALGMAKVRQVQDASDISGSGGYAGFNEFRRFLMLGRSAAELIIIGRAAEIDDICFGDEPSAAAVYF